MARLLALAAVVAPALASYGDCACTCCAFSKDGNDCSPVFQGYNNLKSCSDCSTTLCAKQWPLACPTGPKSGALGFGGHVKFTCDGWDDNSAYEVEGGGGGVFLVILVVCCICTCCRRAQRRTYAPVTAAGGVPMGQPIPVGAYVPPQPATVYVQQPRCDPAASMMSGMMGAVLGAELAGGGRHHHHHGGGHSFHGGGHSTHTSGGF